MKIFFLALILATSTLGSWAQSARSVLDQTAAKLSRGSVVANFTAKGSTGSSSGTITMQNNKFVLSSQQANIWFDGKTEWAHAKGSDEVNMSSPTAGEAATLNPMYFLNLYKKGYDATLNTKGNLHQVHLVAQNKKSHITEMYITIDKSTKLPKEVRLKTGKNSWSSITIGSVQQQSKKNDAFFRFNSKNNPKLEVVDLR